MQKNTMCQKEESEMLSTKTLCDEKSHFMSEAVKENYLIRSKRLLNKLKNPAEKDVIWFFSDEKNFDQDQKIPDLVGHITTSQPTQKISSETSLSMYQERPKLKGQNVCCT
ncbi:uncharacterized protein LOC118763460 [Octopus sinensis]|uniref:Uncharacterized protein LOC118763460 n=1 Tax=Octopus sinensis TaxID=2607531 RepID=A0A7E6ETK4_9MOLL|nr:uncharacterized protein LOC118763460 [Octopus sinensis]